MTVLIWPPISAAFTGVAQETTQLAVLAMATQIDGHVDGVETLITATNTKLDTLHTDVDQIEGYINDVETLITATNTKLDTLHTDLAGVAPGVPQVNVYLDTALDDIPTGSWQNFGSATTVISRWCTFYNGTGYPIQLGWGSAKKLTITPAGWSGPLAIPASTQLQVQSETGSAITSGLVIAAII